MKHVVFFTLMLVWFAAEAQFAPPAGQPGSTAIYKDSSAFAGWATGCTIVRGLRDISTPDSGFATVGDSSMALEKANINGVVSLGDGGYAILTFATPIINGAGWDFAVFENGFGDDFLELAFVEVSSDGINYFRFPATSLTQDSVQVAGFGSIDATKINNLAGKYRSQYGTPFDLDELANESGLDVNHITHVKVIDVVGCIQNQYATYDQHGNKVNDPWSTPFPSGGFDLDAVGVIHQLNTGLQMPKNIALVVYPNPVQQKDALKIYARGISNAQVSVIDFFGSEVLHAENDNAVQNEFTLPTMNLPAGIYFIKINTQDAIGMKRILVSN